MKAILCYAVTKNYAGSNLIAFTWRGCRTWK
jgi:hypothetical protein